MPTLEIQRADLQKVHDIVRVAAEHHALRDEMNAKLHLAVHARFSPLTSELIATQERLEFLLAD